MNTNRQQREQQSIDNKAQHAVEKAHSLQLATAYGLKFVHVRGCGAYGGPSSKAGITVAYSHALPQYGKSNVIRVGIAQTHPNDCYCKTTGRYLAAMRFVQGDTMIVRVPKNIPTAEVLRRMFRLLIEVQ